MPSKKASTVSAPNQSATEPVSTNRLVLTVKVSADGKAYTTAWEGKTYLGSTPLKLDQNLDKAGAPRPRIFKVVPT